MMGNCSRTVRGFQRATSLPVAAAVGILLLLAAGSPAAGAVPGPRPDPARGVFEPTRVWKVHITLPAKEYDAMQPRSSWPGLGGLLGARPPATPDGKPREVRRNTFGMDLPWAVGSAAIGDLTFEDVGIRYKGNGTIGDAVGTIKKSFKLDLSRFGGAAKFHGMRTLNLHSGVADPSRLRETLGYSIYRAAGVHAPRTALAEVRLTVPGKYDNELLGVYTLVEDVNRPFLRARFGSDKGLLLKPEGVRELEDKGDDWAAYKKLYAPKREPTPEEARRVIAFARLVHKADDATFRKEIGSYLEVEEYLRYLAATSFVANSDSFFALGHNYYLYLDPGTRKFRFLPWDLDRAFSNLPVLGTNKQQMNLSLTRPYGGTHRLTDRLLAMPGVASRYQRLLVELQNGCFARGRLLGELDMLEAATKGLVARDAKAASARKESGLPAIYVSPPPLRRFLERRTQSVADQIAGRSRGHVPAAGFRFGAMLAGPVLEALDTDKDELLSKEEWVAVVKRVFAGGKKDDAGRLTQKGVAAAINGMFPRPAKGAPQPPPGFSLGEMMAGQVLKRADADKDGKVSLDDLLAAADKAFGEADKDRSGKLDEIAFADLLDRLLPQPNFGAKPAEAKKETKKP